MGGGEIALRKAGSLREAGARVTVIAPDPDPGLQEMDGVEIIRRAYRRGDLAGFALVFAATGDHSVNWAVAEEAASGGILCNVVDDPKACSFIVPSVVRRDSLLIAITTCGKSPALSKKIRREIEKRYGPEYGALVEILGEMRELVKANHPTQTEREAVFNKLIGCGILELLRAGNVQAARERR